MGDNVVLATSTEVLEAVKGWGTTKIRYIEMNGPKLLRNEMGSGETYAKLEAIREALTAIKAMGIQIVGEERVYG